MAGKPIKSLELYYGCLQNEDRRSESLLMLELLKLQGNYSLPERFVPLQTKKNR